MNVYIDTKWHHLSWSTYIPGVSVSLVQRCVVPIIGLQLRTHDVWKCCVPLAIMYTVHVHYYAITPGTVPIDTVAGWPSWYQTIRPLGTYLCIWFGSFEQYVFSFLLKDTEVAKYKIKHGTFWLPAQCPYYLPMLHIHIHTDACASTNTYTYMHSVPFLFTVQCIWIIYKKTNSLPASVMT